MDQHRTEIDHMLDQVHRNAGPGANIHIAMMQGVNIPLERPDMQQPVPPVEMERHPHAGAKHYSGEQHRIPDKGDRRHYPVGMRPQQQHRISAPDHDAAGQRPENVVVNLITKGKTPATSMVELRDIFGLVALLAKRLEKQVKPAGNNHHQAEIQCINNTYPTQ